MASGRDLLVYTNHSDPLLRANTVTALSSLVQSLLSCPPSISLHGVIVEEHISCDEFEKICKLIGQKMYDESSQTVQSACTAIGCCLEPLLKYSYEVYY